MLVKNVNSEVDSLKYLAVDQYYFFFETIALMHFNYLTQEKLIGHSFYEHIAKSFIKRIKMIFVSLLFIKSCFSATVILALCMV